MDDPINIYCCRLIRNGEEVCSSLDKVFPVKSEQNFNKRTAVKGEKGRFSVGLVPDEPGYYLTKEYAKLAALAVFVMIVKGPIESSTFWEKLFSQPISTLYSINDHWSDSIALKGTTGFLKLPIASVIRHPHGIIFVDLHQLAYKDLTDRTLQISENIDYLTTNPALWPIREKVDQRDLCVIVGMGTHYKAPVNVPNSRVESTEYYKGHPDIPDGTMAVTVTRIKQTTSGVKDKKQNKGNKQGQDPY